MTYKFLKFFYDMGVAFVLYCAVIAVVGLLIRLIGTFFLRRCK